MKPILLIAEEIGQAPSNERPSHCPLGLWFKFHGLIQVAGGQPVTASAINAQAGRLAQAGGRLEAGHGAVHSSLPARRLLARGGLHPADIGVARLGGHRHRRDQLA